MQPKDYAAIVQNNATVRQLGTDWYPMDWKGAVANVMKSTSTLHFKINSCNRILLKKKGRRILVSGESAYNSNAGVARPILKKGKTFSAVSPQLAPIGVPINEKKFRDVCKLLQEHVGHDWRTKARLKYYIGLERREKTDDVEETNVDRFCEPRGVDHMAAGDNAEFV